MSFYFTRDQPSPPPRRSNSASFFNVLSFIARAAAFYEEEEEFTSVADEKFIRIRGFVEFRWEKGQEREREREKVS